MRAAEYVQVWTLHRIAKATAPLTNNYQPIRVRPTADRPLVAPLVAYPPNAMDRPVTDSGPAVIKGHSLSCTLRVAE